MSVGIFKLTSLASTNLNQVGQNQNTDCYGWTLINTTAAAKYVKLYWNAPGRFSSNKDTPTVGTDVPNITIEIPASGTVSQSFTIGIGNSGQLFMATTLNASDTDATAVGAGDVIASIYYG